MCIRVTPDNFAAVKGLTQCAADGVFKQQQKRRASEHSDVGGGRCSERIGFRLFKKCVKMLLRLQRDAGWVMLKQWSSLIHGRERPRALQESLRRHLPLCAPRTAQTPCKSKTVSSTQTRQNESTHPSLTVRTATQQCVVLLHVDFKTTFTSDGGHRAHCSSRSAESGSGSGCTIWTWLLQVCSNPLVQQGGMVGATDAAFDVWFWRCA